MKKRAICLLLTIAMLFSLVPTALAASDEAISAADALYELGLFMGTGTDENGNPVFDLDRAPTRNEAVTMLVRLLGKEEEAKNGVWDTPFTDVVDWVKPYVGYAYANGLTNGTSETTFGGTAVVSAPQYLTFVLRALGYTSGTDFQWDKAWELSDMFGITNGQYNETTAFTRGDVAVISYNALSAPKKDDQSDIEEDSIDLQGYWYGENITADDWLMLQCYYFAGNNYSCAERWFNANNQVLFTVYQEGTFSYSDGILTLTRTDRYSYSEMFQEIAINTEESIEEMQISLFENRFDIVDSSWYYARSDQAEASYNEFKNYVMERNISTDSTNSADYAYLAGTDFRSIRRDYPESVALSAYVYAYTDLNGDLCVLTYVWYKIVNNWNKVTLHNITQGIQITDPGDYYQKQADRAYGANKVHYIDLSIEVLKHQENMLKAMSDVWAYGTNTFDGVYVDADTLNK